MAVNDLLNGMMMPPPAEARGHALVVELFGDGRKTLTRAPEFKNLEDNSVLAGFLDELSFKPRVTVWKDGRADFDGRSRLGHGRPSPLAHGQPMRNQRLSDRGFGDPGFLFYLA